MKYKIFIFEVSDEKKYEFVGEIPLTEEEVKDPSIAFRQLYCPLNDKVSNFERIKFQ